MNLKFLAVSTLLLVLTVACGDHVEEGKYYGNGVVELAGETPYEAPAVVEIQRVDREDETFSTIVTVANVNIRGNVSGPADELKSVKNSALRASISGESGEDARNQSSEKTLLASIFGKLLNMSSAIASAFNPFGALAEAKNSGKKGSSACTIPVDGVLKLADQDNGSAIFTGKGCTHSLKVTITGLSREEKK